MNRLPLLFLAGCKTSSPMASILEQTKMPDVPAATVEQAQIGQSLWPLSLVGGIGRDCHAVLAHQNWPEGTVHWCCSLSHPPIVSFAWARFVEARGTSCGSGQFDHAGFLLCKNL